MNATNTKSKAAEIRAVKVEYVQFENPRQNFVAVTLPNKVELFIPMDQLPGVKGQAHELISKAELGPGGTSLHWPDLEVRFSLESLLLCDLDAVPPMTGVTTAAAAELGRRGGSQRSQAKTLAARLNGARPKRPRKPQSP